MLVFFFIGGMDLVEVKEINEKEINEFLESNILFIFLGKVSNFIIKLDYECDNSVVGKLGVFFEVLKVLNIIKIKFCWMYKVECGCGIN